MGVSAPPRRADSEHDRDLERRVADLEALIEEARRRARRRRRVYAAITLFALGASAWALFGLGGTGGVSLGRVGVRRAAGARRQLYNRKSDPPESRTQPAAAGK